MALALCLGGCIEDRAAAALRVTATDPAPGAEHPADRAVRVVFDGYLDPRMDFARAVTLTSADVAFEARVGYDPSGPALVVHPPVALRPGLGYRLTVLAEHVRGLDGRRMVADHVSGFITRPAWGGEAPAPVDFEAEVAPILAARCSCHGEEPLAFPLLRPEGLVGVPARADPDRLLVAPGDALASELLLKVLPDYPDVRGLPMPPEGPPLDGASIRLLVAWIEGL